MPFATGSAQATPLTVAVPLLGACLAMVVGRKAPRDLVTVFAALVGLAVVGLDSYLLISTGSGRVITWAGGYVPTGGRSVGVVLIVDQIGSGAALIAAVLVTIGLVYSWRSAETEGAHFQALSLLFLAGMQGFALTGDLFDMFVFFELMGALAYALTGFKIEGRSGVQGALNFGIVNSFGAYVSLFGLGLLYSRTGELSLPLLSTTLSGHRADPLLGIIFVLVVTGFLVKAAVVPFHFWTADAEAVAPSPICAIFSGIMVELGVYAVARVYWVVFSGTIPHGDVRRTFVVVGTLTAVVGAVMCFSQRDTKRLLAYSTISHVGLFVLAFAALSPVGVAGAAVYVAGHAGVKAALFLLAGIWLYHYGSVDEVVLRGRGREQRWLFWVWLVAALALAGLPPFGTGLGHDVSESALITAGYPWAPAVYVLSSSLCAGAVLRAAARVHLGWGPAARKSQPSGHTTAADPEPAAQRRGDRTPVTMLLPVGMLLLGALVIGVLPQTSAALAHAAERFVDRTGYVAQSVSGAAPIGVHPLPDVGWSPLGLALSCTSVLLAVGLAALGLWSQRLPAVTSQLVRPLVPVLAALRRAHSGHVGDYLAWLVAGVTGLAALVVTALS